MEGGGGNGVNGEKFRFPLRMNGDYRDLENGAASQTHSPREDEVKTDDNDEEMELSLGLSMNGRFGVDPARKKLRRYSSISSLAVPVEGGGGVRGGGCHARGVGVEPYAPLGRTCSLPSEPEEWRHRKVLQSTMSMEARKKRMEKLKNGRLVKDKESCLDSCNGAVEVVHENESGLMIKNGPFKVVQNGHKNLPSEASIGAHMISKVPLDVLENGHKKLSSQGSIGSHMISEVPLGVVENGHTNVPLQVSIGSHMISKVPHDVLENGHKKLPSQGSIGSHIVPKVPLDVLENGHKRLPSQGSNGSRIMSNVSLDVLENGHKKLPAQGSVGSHMISKVPLDVVENRHTNLPSQGSIGSQGSGSSGISDVQSQETEGAKQTAEMKSSASNRSVQDQGSQEPDVTTASVSLKSAMLDMPFVSTKENGSNGNKVDGFLYRYKKGEEVRIVCVCHGKFLSPAEFVKHGGGGDVEHPLKHIVVNPSPLF